MKKKIIPWERILEDTIITTVSQYIARFLGLISGILLRRWLGPFFMGIWAGFRIILGYGEYTSIGTHTAIAREYPLLTGAGKSDAAEKYKNTGVSFIIIVSIITGIVLSIWARVFRHDFTPEVYYGLYALAAINLFLQLFNIYVILMRCEHAFKKLSLVYILAMGQELLFIIIFVPRLKITGLYIAILLAYIVNVFIIKKISGIGFSFSWNPVLLKKITGYGFVLFIIGILTATLENIDKIMCGIYLGAKSLGYYTIPMLALSIISDLTRRIEIILQPRMQEQFGESPDTGGLNKYVTGPIEGYINIIPFCVAGILYFFPPFVFSILPEYTAGLLPLPFILIGSFFYSLSYFPVSFLITLKENRYIIRTTLVVLVSSALFNRLAIYSGGGLVGISIVTMAHLSLFTLIITRKINTMLDSDELSEFWKRIGFQIVYILITLYLVSFAGKDNGSWTVASLRFILFCLFMVPPFARYEKRTHFIKRSFKLILDKISDKQ